MTSILPPVAQELGLVTCADDLRDLHTGDVDLLGELADRLVGVLVGERVDVDLDPRRPREVGGASHGGGAVGQVRSEGELWGTDEKFKLIRLEKNTNKTK